jgi:hypothetical protein
MSLFINNIITISSKLLLYRMNDTILDNTIFDNTIFDNTIQCFLLYRDSHPNLSQCWIEYLALKKRNYGSNVAAICNQAANVLSYLHDGKSDLTKADIVRLIIYKHTFYHNL